MHRETKENWNIIRNNLFFKQQELYKTLIKKKISIPDMLRITNEIVDINKEIKRLILHMKENNELEENA